MRFSRFQLYRLLYPYKVPILADISILVTFPRSWRFPEVWQLDLVSGWLAGSWIWSLAGEVWLASWQLVSGWRGLAGEVWLAGWILSGWLASWLTDLRSGSDFGSAWPTPTWYLLASISRREFATILPWTLSRHGCYVALSDESDNAIAVQRYCVMTDLILNVVKRIRSFSERVSRASSIRPCKDASRGSVRTVC